MNNFESSKKKVKPAKVIYLTPHQPAVINKKGESRSRTGAYVAWPETNVFNNKGNDELRK
jgi:hypothetical protein